MYTVGPLQVYRADASSAIQAKLVFDTAAAAGAYMITGEGCDTRTTHHFTNGGVPVSGVGNGSRKAEYGGTWYVGIETVRKVNGRPTSVESVIRFDGIYVPSLSSDGKSLVSHLAFTHDGGFDSIRAMSNLGTKQITHHQQLVMRVGAVGALTNPEARVEILATQARPNTPGSGLLMLPEPRFLSQDEIEALVPSPPPSLLVMRQFIDDRYKPATLKSRTE